MFENFYLCLSIFLVKDVTHVQASLKGIIFGAPIPFPIPHPRPCGLEESELKCPLKPDQPQVYQLMLPVKTAYPKVSISQQSIKIH